MGHTLEYMYQKLTSLGIDLGRMKLLQMSWEYALKICNSFMCYRVGRVPLQIRESFVMPLVGDMV